MSKPSHAAYLIIIDYGCQLKDTCENNVVTLYYIINIDIIPKVLKRLIFNGASHAFE